MNANLIRYGIIAGAVLGTLGVGYGGYKGTKALRRRSAEKRAAAQASVYRNHTASAEAAPDVTTSA